MNIRSTLSVMPKLAGVLTLALVMLGVGACATVDRQQVGSWREAVVATREQSAVTFRAANELVRDSQLKRAKRLAELKEEDFSPGLDGLSVRRWNAALDAMAQYAGAVEQLLSPDLPASVGESLKKTGAQLSTTANLPLLEANGAISTAIGAIGKKLVAMAANTRARDIMLATDADVKALTEAMAKIMYDDSPIPGADPEAAARTAIAATVETTWNQRLAEIESEFRASSPDAKRGLVKRYIDQVAGKHAALDAVMGLRRTLLDLGPAHTAAAQGRATSLESVIAAAREQVTVVSAVIAQLQAERAAAAH